MSLTIGKFGWLVWIKCDKLKNDSIVYLNHHLVVFFLCGILHMHIFMEKNIFIELLLFSTKFSVQLYKIWWLLFLVFMFHAVTFVKIFIVFVPDEYCYFYVNYNSFNVVRCFFFLCVSNLLKVASPILPHTYRNPCVLTVVILLNMKVLAFMTLME